MTVDRIENSVRKSRKLLIVDSHEDIAFNAINLRRNFLASAQEKRVDEGDNLKHGMATVGLPDLVKGNVRIVFATIWAPPCNSPRPIVQPCYTTQKEACVLAKQQLNYYLALASSEQVTLVTKRADLDLVLSDDQKIGLVLLMEGADPLVMPSDVREWYAAGLRIIGPAWRKTSYAGGTGNPGPLTDAGRELIAEMERLGIILDVSHLAEASFFEALELFSGPVIASHSNCRKYVPTDRQLSDDMIRTLVQHDGIMGIVLYNSFLKNSWENEGKIKSQVTLHHVLEQIQHVCEIAGNAKHVGIGTDFDGGFGAESIPAELDTVADLWKVHEALAAVQFSEEDMNEIMSGNWLRILRNSLPV